MNETTRETLLKEEMKESNIRMEQLITEKKRIEAEMLKDSDVLFAKEMLETDKITVVVKLFQESEHRNKLTKEIHRNK